MNTLTTNFYLRNSRYHDSRLGGDPSELAEMGRKDKRPEQQVSRFYAQSRGNTPSGHPPSHLSLTPRLR